MPDEERAQPAAGADADQVVPRALGTGATTVLYVDGDGAAREQFLAADDDGPSVEVAPDGRSALARLPAVDCVVATHPLPDRSGPDLAEAVAERDPDLPVFVRASRDARSARERAAEETARTNESPADGMARAGERTVDGAALAGEATVAGAAGYFPANASVQAILDRADAAAVAYRRRRRQAREADLLGRIQDNLPVAVYVKDDQARHLWATDVPEGPDPETMVGKTDLEVYGDDDPEIARQGYEDDLEVLETGEPVVNRQERMEGVSEDGYEYVVWTLTTKVPLRDEDGDVTGLVGASWDITDLKADQQEAEELERQFERFVSFISHDLVNPLAVARGYLALAEEVDEPSDEVLAEIDTALDRMEEIIDDARSLAEGDAGADEVPFVNQVDLAGVAREAWETVGSSSATFRCEVEEGAAIGADRGQLMQLLENLLKNAVDHGGPEVAVEVGLLDDGTGFYVADDGPGIPAAKRDQVFDFGFKVDRGGTGIGLTIVREVAEAHNWTLAVTESAAGGARFEVGDCLLVGWPDRLVDAGTPVALSESRDVGGPRPGRTTAESGTWTLEGGGRNVWDDVAEYRYAAAAVDGDARVRARLLDLEAVSEYSKAGVVVRGEDDDDPLGFVGLTPDNGSEVLWRPAAGAEIESRQFRDAAAAPYWYQIDRRGDVVTCSVSVDGDEWTTVDQRRLPLGETVHVGLLVNSHEAGTLCTARFDAVEALDAGDGAAHERE